MPPEMLNEAQKAISAEAQLQHCYRKMQAMAINPKVKAVIHDLLLMEEMNEVLLRSLQKKWIA
ncbi:MAG: hypothetical protein A2729_05725 [Candidatus Buchananbacteria bacterium RIFCSPHIGHO2_01_FULL_39_14]|uniref:Uncharacterized protein n=2 Tax=Candidatus Buchananiibacteriota TaxID=1817903 RepID=A0A1G1YSH2_9BACT|nr:MAG: hypothetical protein A2729_05725 [Candidatus Buchananbacteria bacterium RIFCSPHIGHO2_01_FULL_39_14]OGY48465.1 MAG: hypothetical protein A3D39_02540 [Candidatus Buchananbacteria bacterium RIFCSPHIGHO2_02_FULL_39_17]OGY55295.1 MAG: hypothetical protein A2912_02545 [Candidatus Buchananbacteria bacterium RIFCSPLOWO2_01_FULL_40_23b]